MSPLTKAFVVLVTVLSILLVTLVVPFVHQVDTMKTELENAQAVASAAQQTIQDSRADKTAITEQLKSKEASLNNTINQLQSKVAELEGVKTGLDAKLAKAQSDNQAIQAAMTSLGASQESTATLLENYVAQIKSTNTKLVEGQTENVQLVDRNNQLQSNLSALERQVRKLREDLVARSEEVAMLERQAIGGGAVAAGGATASFVPDEPIYGQITETARTAAGKGLVTLNLGSSDGLVQNQRFVAYRGNNELVATLEVKSVDASQAVAAVISEQQGIAAGDYVVSAPGL